MVRTVPRIAINDYFFRRVSFGPPAIRLSFGRCFSMALTELTGRVHYTACRDRPTVNQDLSP